MSAEVDKTSHVEPGNVKMSGTTISSAAPMGSQKVSMFAAKTGFVIPKNKLSGSLVPIFRGNKKLGGSESANGENDKQAQRKTKWGPDLTQDTAVRKGRFLAYQTRLEQITQLLKSGTLEVPESQDAALEPENLEDKSPGSQVNNKDSQVQNTELLELEKREVIGEILKLNPSFRAPPDYRPMLKEDKFSLPVKEYPGYNFIGLIYGPNGENQKRLEKETGVKIRICGVKAETGEKGEIKPTDGHETQNAYDELFVCMSADTFDKIDAAISVIELLLTSISGNLTTNVTSSDLVSGDNKSFSSQSEGTATSNIGLTTVLNQGVMQQVQVHAPTPMQGQFHFPSTWFPTDPPHNSTPTPGLFSQPNPSATILNNPIHLSTPTSHASNVPSLFGRPPAPIAFNPAFRNPPVHSLGQQLPAQGLQQPFMAQISPGQVGPPRVPALLIQRPSLVQSSVSAPNFIGSGPLPSGLPQNVPGSSVPSSLPQLVASSFTPGSLPDRPVTSSMISTGLSGATVGSSASLGPNNMGQMNLSVAPPFGPSAGPRQGVTSGAAPANITVANVDSYATFPSGPSIPQATGIPTNRPITAPIPSPQMGPRPPFSAPPTLLPLPAHNLAGNFVAASASTPPKPPLSTGNFTFQPHGPQNPSAQTVINLNVQNSPSVPALQQSAPGAPSFHLAVPNFPRLGSQLFPGTQAGNQIGNPQIQELAASNPIGLPVAPRLTAFLDSAPRTQMHQRNFSPAMQMPNLQGNYPHRPGNPMQLEQGLLARGTRPEIRFAPNQQFSSNLSFVSGKPPSSSGGQQIYDPFSPTSVSVTQQQWSK